MSKFFQIESLNSQISSLESSITLKEVELEGFKADLESSVKQQILDKEIEFQKLLVENTSLICDIDSAQDHLEATEAELSLLKAELDEIKTISSAKVEEFKEIISEKNFSITNLEGVNAGLIQEISQLKQEVSDLQAGFDTQIKAAQAQFARLFTELVSICFEADEKIFGFILIRLMQEAHSYVLNTDICLIE